MTIISDAEIRLKEVNMPEYYLNYQHEILKNVERSFELATIGRKMGLDVSDRVEPKIAYDLADRVAKMHNIDIADRLRALLSHTTKEKATLKIAEEIALGEYGIGDLRTRLDNAVRVSLAVMTEGVTVAPLQGIADVQLKNNANGSQYLSVSFAGPIRSAGGTEAALTMLIADHIRKVAGVDKYIANSYDDETGRFVEELRIYEREVGNFQFKILDEDVVKCITNLPVELDGVDTDPVEVVGHRGMNRISTDRVRGGALRVMNDGLIGRSRKLLKLVEILKLDGWDWLNDLKGAIQTGDDDDAAHHRMSEVITGRPVLSMTKKIGGFRLRYGRCCNTGFATVGIHSVVPILLNHGIVVQVSTVDQATKIRSRVDKILYLGDILISYGDFLENNAQLLPASYVEEIWALQLHSKLLTLSSSDFSIEKINNERLIQLSKDPFTTFPTVEEAFEISKKFDIPLHPKYSFYWDSINIDTSSDTYLLSLDYDPRIKDILERLGIIHSVKNGDNAIKINSQDQSYSLTRLLLLLPSSQSAAIENMDDITK